MRDYRDGDSVPLSELLYATAPYLVVTPDGLHAQVTRSPARQHFRLLVAEEGGTPVGCVRTGLFADTSDTGLSFANLTVAPGARHRGVGGALLAAAEEHLTGKGAHTVYAWAADDPGAHAFAARHAYRRGRSASFQRLGLTDAGSLPAVPELPAGVELLPASHWADDPSPLHAADQEAFQDEPGDVNSDAISLADWKAVTWDRPGFDPELSIVPVVDGEVAGMLIVETDGRTRYWSGGTGIRRAHRGRGLAKAAKAHSLHLARTRGLREAYTSNDDGNEPMLAVNRWLGYRPCATEWRYIRDLTDRT
ncbi:GNAT family N-acetyltransferase [Streptomyces sp. PLK6-54]|uniref:GNAT family N-acetyltransferase n=1 Tax=Actinacidiphila acidipaludis TaxID=2873382 RepID=A0ABS7Q3Y0_9ACTN|nr:GNAT family N-acetyltransferase [Streptomyces acidipaludis]